MNFRSPGAHVETHSLTTTELNGKFGRIQGRQGGRFEVIFDDIRYGGKSLKVSNLRIVTSLDVDMTSHARDSNSTLPLVHIDPPARIDQDEAAQIVAQQEAGLLERLLSSTLVHESEGPSVATDTEREGLWKIELKRCGGKP